MARLVPKNWISFQHYKDRSPPWIKLHKELLDDSRFQRLPVASRALAPMLWLLASESKDGVFDGDTDELAFRLRQTTKEIEAGLNPLIEKGFFILAQVDSALLADCVQLAVPETEGEAEAKKEAEADAGKPRSSRTKSETTLAEYLASCKLNGVKPVPDDHFIRTFAADAGITNEMLQVAWTVFRDDHLSRGARAKKYSDWALTFANAVKGGYQKIWFTEPSGEIKWTSVGLTHKTAIEARMAREAA